MKRHISSLWKADCTDNIYSDVRAYISPRGIEYPAISGSPVYTAVSAASNVPGSYNLTGGVLVYLYTKPTSLSITVYVNPAFTYNVASDQTVWDFGGAFGLIYNATSDKWAIRGSTTLDLGSAYTSNATLQQWTRITVTYNGTTATGYINGSATSGSVTVSSTIQNQFTINATDKAINHLRIFEYVASATEEGNQYQDVTRNEVFFRFNRTTHGIERTNVTPYLVSYSINAPGTQKAATADISLQNLNGYFNDDVYDNPTGLFPSDTLYPTTTLYPYFDLEDYAPETGNYNGPVNKRYLERKMPLFIESWYGTLFEPLYFGYIQPNSFRRTVSVGGVSIISLAADDSMADMAKRVSRRARTYENYYICSEANRATSLFHVLSKLAIDREIYNYCANSGMENTDISLSWNGVSKSSTQAFSGTYSALVPAGGYGNQVFMPQNLSYGEKFSFSCYVYSTTGTQITAQIQEKLGALNMGGSQYTISHSGNGWERIEVTHTITDSDSDRLVFGIKANAATYFDNAMLNYGDPKKWYIANTNDGAGGGVVSYTLGTLGTYESIGIDADEISYIHPWAIVKEGANILNELRSLIDSTCGIYFYIDSSNVLRYKSIMNTARPSTSGTISDIAQVGSGWQDQTANKLKVSGIKITKATLPECVWQAAAGGPDNEATNGGYKFTMLPLFHWPTYSDSPDGFECKYDDTEEIVVTPPKADRVQNIQMNRR